MIVRVQYAWGVDVFDAVRCTYDRGIKKVRVMHQSAVYSSQHFTTTDFDPMECDIVVWSGSQPVAMYNRGHPT